MKRCRVRGNVSFDGGRLSSQESLNFPRIFSRFLVQEKLERRCSTHSGARTGINCLMKMKLFVLLSALLATARVQAQFVIDCVCLAQQPGMHVTNCTATIPDLC